jgi:hypothetical protein
MSESVPNPVKIQTSSESVPSTPAWLGEVALMAHALKHWGIIEKIEQEVRFARARFGQYEVIDFVAVLMGYALSAEPTLFAFYERLIPFAGVFMALFEREKLPSRSALSRFLAALDRASVEALRQQFQADLVARGEKGKVPGGMWDHHGKLWLAWDIDGTRQAARQRALPQTDQLPPAHRRFDQVCAKGYLGRKRGEVVRTRTTVLQAHSHQWAGTYSGRGNGDYRGELLQAMEAIKSYAGAYGIPPAQVLIRLDGLYGNAAPLIDVLGAGLGVIVRGKEYGLLDLPAVQAVLAQPSDQQTTHPESGTTRTLFDCPSVPLGPAGPVVRMVLAAHPAESCLRVGKRSTNSFSRPCPKKPLAAKMCLICICIGGPSRPCLGMKMWSKTLIGGVLRALADKSFGKFWLNGCGICALSWDNSSLPPRCA